MFRKVRYKLKPQVASRRKRADVLRVRGLLERLEERAMLSASYDIVAHGYDGHDFEPGSISGQRFVDSAAFAQQQRSLSYDTQMYSVNHVWGESYRGIDSRAPMQTATLQSGPRVQALSQQLPQNQAWTPAFAGPPLPPPPGYPAYFETAYFPTTITWEIHAATASTNAEDTKQFGSTSSNGGKTLQVKSPQDTLQAFFDALNNNRFTGGQQNLQVQMIRDPGGPLIPPGIGTVAIASAATDTSASEIVSHETSALAAITSIARDVAFQEFAAQLFQPNAAAASNRVNASGLDSDANESEIVDGFIRPSDASLVDESGSSTDAVAREREAIDAVLDELHNVDLLAPADASADVADQIVFQSDEALEAMPGGAVDGGMVLLQAMGEANETNFDLAAVYAEHFEKYDGPAKIETSVGIFQAVDVAIDEAPLVEVATKNDSTSTAQPETKLNDNLSTKRDKASSSTSATLVGATTLTGALAWLTRSGRRSVKQSDPAQKRRATRR